MARVWVPSWEFQCCGSPFAVGFAVSWWVTTNEADRTFFDVLLPNGVAPVDGMEGHHDDLPYEVVGAVTSIEGVQVEYGPVVNDARPPVPKSAVLTPLRSGDGWEEEASFAYLVTIDGKIRPRTGSA